MIQTKNLWAPVIIPSRGKPWILWGDIAYLRGDAKANYLRGVGPDAEKRMLNRVKFMRVTVTVQEGA